MAMVLYLNIPDAARIDLQSKLMMTGLGEVSANFQTPRCLQTPKARNSKLKPQRALGVNSFVPISRQLGRTTRGTPRTRLW